MAAVLEAELTLDDLPDAVCLLGADSRLRPVNRVASAWLAGPLDLAGPGASAVALFHPDDESALRNAFFQARAGRTEIRVTARLGRGDAVRRVDLHCQRRADGSVVVVLRDANTPERRRTDTGATTGGGALLATSRDELEGRVRAALTRLRPGSTLAVFAADVDRFRDVNEVYGRDTGDELIAEVGRRLRSTMRTGDLVFRIGVDQFVVVAENLPGPAAVTALTARLEAATSRPVDLHGHSITTTISIGCAIARPGVSARELLVQADEAMDTVKSRRKGRRIAANDSATRRWIADELAKAVSGDGLSVHYQPVVALDPARVRHDPDDWRTLVVGFEALVRWHHPARGDVPPGDFVPIAVQTGLDRDLGALVLRDAVANLRTWNEHRPTPLGMMVNITSSHLHDPSLPSLIRRVTGEHGVDPTWLWVEFTEETALEKPAVADAVTTEQALAGLDRLGVRIALDDFGTGFASLNRVRHLPVSMVKIDRSFVQGLSDSPEDEAIVRAVAALGRGLRIEVLAEGIETIEQAAAAAACGCTLGQGWHFGRAEPADAVTARLAG